jgi:pimeloyl-ACP methyl ester carboxylesterase
VIGEEQASRGGRKEPHAAVRRSIRVPGTFGERMRAVASVAGVLLAIPYLAVVALGLVASYSPSGWLMLLGLALVIAGMATASRRRTRRRGIARAGLAVLALVVAGRETFAGRGNTTMITLPGGSASRWLGRVIDEQDVSLVGARALGMVWALPAMERALLAPAMHDAYVAMRASEGTTASPVLDTLLDRQAAGAFDSLVIEPQHGPPGAAVVFLHGYAGSFTLECWMVAEAARTIGAVTVCPSTGFDGRWWTDDGERTLRATLAYVRERHVPHVYLAGLSNGAIGASLLVPRFAGSLAGLILIAGESPDGTTAGLPTLVLHGERDSVLSAPVAHAFAARTGATYAGFDGGHFVMMVRRTEVRDAIGSWLQATETRP